MKQCPECREHFNDEQNFCDSDGSALVDETVLLRNALAAAEPPSQQAPGQPRQIWPIVTIGILIGIIISLSAYVLLVMPSAEKAEQKANRANTAKLNASDSSTQPAVIKSAPLPVASAEPSPEASPSPSASPSPAVAEAPQEPPASLNNGPISTDVHEGEKRGHTLIKLKSGVLVEADAAWADRMGIWYRQGGLVSYVERDRIESISEPPQPKSADISKP
ncbi:MAG TPA: hypothetical protein VJ875_01015 [Pyrinomonadaceae bacterium]|nr:hypothetical protein [Pyrinomonadaceae bacterium]